MFSPNILITNYCNQNCPYCFADSLMKDKKIDKEMNLINFKKIIRKINKIKNVNTLKLLGGEPTLHSKFKEIIKISLHNFDYIQIFTNGLFSDDIESFLKKYFPRVRLTINIMTPGFLYNKNLRKLVVKKIMKCSKLTDITLSIVTHPRSNIKFYIGLFNQKFIKNIKHIRIGASNPIADNDNFYKIEDFPKIGNKIVELIKGVLKINPNIEFDLDCGFVRCMFSNEQHNFLKSINLKKDFWGCYLGNLDIQTNMKAIICYPLSTLIKIDLSKHSINEIEKYFIVRQYIYLSKYKIPNCKNCKYFGFDDKQCSGPCIAFSYNIGHYNKSVM